MRCGFQTAGDVRVAGNIAPGTLPPRGLEDRSSWGTASLISGRGSRCALCLRRRTRLLRPCRRHLCCLCISRCRLSTLNQPGANIRRSPPAAARPETHRLGEPAFTHFIVNPTWRDIRTAAQTSAISRSATSARDGATTRVEDVLSDFALIVGHLRSCMWAIEPAIPRRKTEFGKRIPEFGLAFGQSALESVGNLLQQVANGVFTYSRPQQLSFSRDLRGGSTTGNFNRGLVAKGCDDDEESSTLPC